MLHQVYLMKQIPLLNFLSEKEMLIKLRSGKFKITSYIKDSIVHLEGENCTKFEIILSGKVVVDQYGKEL
jgi:hypothetical protein